MIGEVAPWLWIAVVAILVAALLLVFQLGVSWGSYPWPSRRAFLRRCAPEMALTLGLLVGALALAFLLGVR
jgi:hypothetical protein